MSYNGTLRLTKAIRLLRWRKELTIGIDAARKRQILMDVARMHAIETPSAAVSAIRELNAMDGDNAALEIKHSGTLNVVSIDYQMDIGRQIEGKVELEEPVPELPDFLK